MNILLANKAVSNFRSELLGNTMEQLLIEDSVFYNLGTPKHIFLHIYVYNISIIFPTPKLASTKARTTTSASELLLKKILTFPLKK